MLNLNTLKIASNEGEDRPLGDYGVDTCNGKVSVYFRNLEDYLIQCIEEADSVCGCVAWLTNEAILRALAAKTAVSILVQKEDFLRPDFGARGVWARRLRALYAALPANWDRRHAQDDSVLAALAWGSSGEVQAVRCLGVHNADRRSAMPRCHHKFIVFCKDVPAVSPHDRTYTYVERVPYAAWTGSFNFTANGTSSLENAVLLRDVDAAWAYYYEWAQLQGLSERLDWSTEWVEPEWKIGT